MPPPCPVRTITYLSLQVSCENNIIKKTINLPLIKLEKYQYFFINLENQLYDINYSVKNRQFILKILLTCTHERIIIKARNTLSFFFLNTNIIR